jgi:hypothetical protein
MIVYPDLVTDPEQAVPDKYLVGAKKAIFLLVAAQKLRHLHNGVWKWLRGEPLSAEEEAVVSEQFGARYPGDPPDEAEAVSVSRGWWKARNTEVHAELSRIEDAIPVAFYDLVDLSTIIG